LLEFASKNQQRLDRLLVLMGLHLNDQDSELSRRMGRRD